MLSYLDFSLASIDGWGWHAQNGMELHDLAFLFQFALALFRWIGWLDWLPGSDEHQKILEDACMKEWATGKLYIRDCRAFEEALVGG
jgi:hypothetical protein